MDHDKISGFPGAGGGGRRGLRGGKGSERDSGGRRDHFDHGDGAQDSFYKAFDAVCGRGKVAVRGKPAVYVKYIYTFSRIYKYLPS